MSKTRSDPKARLPSWLTRVSWRDLAVRIPTLLVLAAAFAAAGCFARPAPPDRIVMTAGHRGRTFRDYGERYRCIALRGSVAA